MANPLLVFGVLFAVTVTRTGAEVSLPFNTRDARIGRSINIKCTVTGETFVAWNTPTKPASPGKPAIPSKKITTTDTSERLYIAITGDDYVLTITGVTADDGGDYTCEGQVSQPKTFTLNVDFVSEDVVKNQELKYNTKDTLVLDVFAYPNPTYSWKKDGILITFPQQGKTLNPYSGSITFDKVAKSDQGKYTCDIVWQAGLPSETTASVDIDVIVTEVPSIKKNDVLTKGVTLTKGNDVTFHCDVLTGSPTPTITWYFGWEDSSTKKVDKDYDARYSHPDDEKWKITGILESDKGDYRCVAENTAGKAVLLIRISAVDVRPAIKPIQDVVANEGDKVELLCEADGKPAPTVEWRLDSVKVPKQMQHKGNSTISFATVNLRDAAEYTCVAWNGALDDQGNTIMAEEKVNLYVKSPPKINKDASDTPIYSYVANIKPVTVQCVFYGYPVPTVKMVAENGTEVASGASSASITLVTNSVDDFGRFNCTAENTDGEKAEFSVELKLAVAPGPPSEVAVETTCKTITVMWKPPKDNGGLQVDGYVIEATGPNVSHTQTVPANLEEKVIDYTFKPETEYTIKIKATTAVSPGPDVLQQPVTTKKYCKPGRPLISNTEKSIEDCASFTLTWVEPISDGGDDLIQYKVEYSKTTGGEVKTQDDIDGTSLKIEDLECGAEYEFKVYAKNQAGEGEPASKTLKVADGEVATTGSASAFTTGLPPTSAKFPTSASSTSQTARSQTVRAYEPGPKASKDPGLGAGAIAGIVIAVILIVLITIDLFCCFFNSCGVIFCCHKALCGGGGGGGAAAGGGDKDYMDGNKVPATEMEKQPLPENV